MLSYRRYGFELTIKQRSSGLGFCCSLRLGRSDAFNSFPVPYLSASILLPTPPARRTAATFSTLRENRQRRHKFHSRPSRDMSRFASFCLLIVFQDGASVRKLFLHQKPTQHRTATDLAVTIIHPVHMNKTGCFLIAISTTHGHRLILQQ